MFKFTRNKQTPSKVTGFYTLISNTRELESHHIFATTWVLSVLEPFPWAYGSVSCAFSLIASDAEHLSLCLLVTHRYVFFCELSSHFGLGVFWVGRPCFLYILNTSLLSNMCSTIFFPPVCGLPFQMPFEDQKFYILMLSNFSFYDLCFLSPI